MITAHISVRENRLSVLGDQIAVPDLAGLSAAQPFTVTIPVSACTPHNVRALRETLQRHPGGTERLRGSGCLAGKAGPRFVAVDPQVFRITTHRR